MNAYQPQLSRYQMLRIKQVQDLTGLSRSKIYEMLDPRSPRHDPSFPKRVQLTECSVGWVASEIDQWLESRINQSRLAYR